MWLLGTSLAFLIWHFSMRKRGLGILEIQALFLTAGLGGVLLSRIWFFSEYPHFFSIQGLLTGPGLRWHAFLISASLTMVIGARWIGIEMGKLFDGAALAVAPGQAIGRVGCILVGDSCIGKTCDLPWGVVIRGIEVHPTPIYEAINLSIISSILFFIDQKKPKPWLIAFTYFTLSGLQRFVVQFWRSDPTWIGPISQYHVIALATSIIGIAGLAVIKKAQPASR
jgi:phosphatidylglycerol:prolipoprotein diacylglycerol transferase